jgi:hypothetical protein
VSSEDLEVIYCRYIRLKNGRVLDAHKYGRKAWRFTVRKRTN